MIFFPAIVQQGQSIFFESESGGLADHPMMGEVVKLRDAKRVKMYGSIEMPLCSSFQTPSRMASWSQAEILLARMLRRG